MSAQQDISPKQAKSDQPDYGPDKRGHKGPERRCIVTKQSDHKHNLLRFVRSPDGIVMPDILEKLPGRGAYILPTLECLNKAVETKAFNRAFKGKAVVPDDIGALVSDILSRRVLGLITMAMKAGRLRMGSDQVRGLTQSGELAIRIEARDGAADGRGKLRSLAKAVGRATDGGVPPLVGCFTALELGQAVGRPPIVHAGIDRGRFAKTMKHDIVRLSGFRALIPLEWEDRQHEL